MKIIFSEHAERKIEQRNLKNSWIIETVGKPDYLFETYKDRFKAYKKIGKLYLVVIYVKESKKSVIITAHWEKVFNPPNKEKSYEN